MTSKNQLPPNSILVSKESSIPRTTDFIDSQLDRQTEVQIRCAGTSVEKGILIAEKCVALGIAQYSRFTTQLVPFEGREVLYTIIKLKRVPASKKPQQQAPKKQQKQLPNNQKRPQNNNQHNNRKPSQDQYQPERDRRQTYNDDHRERNERRQQQRYNEKGQRNNQRNYNQPIRRENEYRK